jgi:O-acetylserine/cysteine efflux transporter
MKPAHLAFILLIDLIWAVNVVAVKELIDTFGPVTGVFLRYVVVLLVTLPWLRVVRGRMGAVVVSGLVSGALFMGLGGISFAVTDNVAALAIVGQLGVPFSLILAVIFLGETIRWVRIAGTAAAFVGIVVMGFDPAIWDERLGVALTIAASFVWAVGSLLFRRLQGVNPLTIHAWLAAVSVPVLLIAAWVFEPDGFAAVTEADVKAFAWLVYAAVGSSVVGHAGMSWLLQRYPVTTMAPLTLPTPLLSAIIATLVYDTPVSVEFVMGALITFAGVATVTWRSATRQADEGLVKEWTGEARR